ncbi:MAG: tetratricopeptide repeat protein [Desulfovibrio sp.]|jgi:tetratricopeptide (TPR) repeat protein|nr:tetratricopeptide repeat protein [Desulfovibrio sp.]
MSSNADYVRTITEFIQKDRGYLVGATEDASFASLVRNLFHKQLNLDPGAAFLHLPNPNLIEKSLTTALAGDRRPFLILDHRFRGQNMAPRVRDLKKKFPDTPLLFLILDTDQDRILYLYELGVNSFIVKPTSAQTVLEKLAFTLKPLGELGQFIDAAKILLRQGRSEEAKSMAAQILKIKPDSPAGLMMLGDAEQKMGHPDAARQAYEKAHAGTPLYLEPLQRLASLAETCGTPEERLAWLERLDALSPLNPDRKVDMGEINLNLGNEQKAENLFSLALDLAKEIKEQISALAERIADVYIRTDPGKSEFFLRKALEAKKNRMSRDEVQVFNRLGITLRQMGKWEEALAEYRRALDLAPDDAGLYYNMGLALAQGNRMLEARKSMETALRLDARFVYTSADVAYNLGDILLKGAGKELAKKCFAVALELDPDLDEARRKLDSL